MDISVPQIVNIVFSSLIILLAILGYILTLKRMGEKWFFWLLLAIGWALFAICNAFAMTNADIAYLYAVWLSSYVLVMASMVLLFFKLIRLREK